MFNQFRYVNQYAPAKPPKKCLDQQRKRKKKLVTALEQEKKSIHINSHSIRNHEIAWKLTQNPEFKEKFCHFSGKRSRTVK